jgi:hypothetical protein
VEFNGLDIVNLHVPDSVEMCVRPSDYRDAIVRATYNGMEECGCDEPGTMSGWGSRGSSYSDLYDGRPKHGRLVTKVSKGVINTEDMSFKAYPTVIKNQIIFAATCAYASAKGADGLSLYRLGAAFAGCTPDEVPTGLRVKVDAGVRPKRLSNLSVVTRHSIAAFPNAGGCITLARPLTSDIAGAEDESRISVLGNLQG